MYCASHVVCSKFHAISHQRAVHMEIGNDKGDIVSDLMVIAKSGILSKELMEQFELVKDDCLHSMTYTQIFRTRTEMEVSVLNDMKFPTHASKYWQVIREQAVMTEELIRMSFDYRRNLIKLEIINREIVAEEDELKRDLLMIDKEELLFAITNQERVAADRIREVINWNELKKRYGEHMTDVEKESPNNHQLISYTRRWIMQSMQMGDNGSPAERQNLLGQLQSGLDKCIEIGILDEVLSPFNNSIKKKMKDRALCKATMKALANL